MSPGPARHRSSTAATMASSSSSSSSSSSRGQRAIAHLDRIRAAGDLDHRRRLVASAEVPREALGIERCRRHDDLEIGPLAHQPLEIAEQEIDVEAALVRLVDDDRVVRGELPVALRFGEQYAVGHQLDERVRARAIGEAHLVTHGFAQRRPQLLRDARRDAARGDASRLRVADQAAQSPPDLEADLRQLRGLAGAGLATDDHHRDAARIAAAISSRRDGHRQFGRIRDRAARAPRASATRSRDAATARIRRSISVVGALLAAGTLDARRERAPVRRHAEGEFGQQSIGDGDVAVIAGSCRLRHSSGSTLRRARSPGYHLRFELPWETTTMLRPNVSVLAAVDACLIALVTARRRRQDLALGGSRRHEHHRSAFAERESHQQYQFARLRHAGPARQGPEARAGARRVVAAGQSDDLALQAASGRQVPRRHAVHGRRRRLQLRACALRQFAIARVCQRFGDAEEDRRPDGRVHHRRARIRSNWNTSRRSTS